MSAKCEVRIRQIPSRFVAGRWETEGQPVKWMGDVGKWTMVRRADFHGCAPFVISRREWDKLPLQEAPQPNSYP